MSALTDLNSVVPPQAAVGYFVDQKKGEVNELKLLLKNLNVEKDIRRKREIVKKVIAYMTLGIDVSRLFTDMIMAIETKDIVMKKMIYLYLSNYAHSEPEMAIMCINSLRRDCDNEDPLVRGLALRSLCSLRMESMLEYVEQPLHKAFDDISAYVRKTAVMAVLKLHYLSPALVTNNGYLGKLHTMLNDSDANVVTNALHVINELELSKGGLVVTQSIIMSLLNRIGEFSEWGLNTILDLVSRYRPASEDEVYAVMNLLDPVLRTANSGSVLATLKAFIQLTSSLPELHPQIILRSKPPLLTLITGGHPEAQYMTLKHLQNILHQPAAKGVFDDEYRQFFVRYNEPPHVKHLKVDLLPMIANSSNARDIATELNEYVTDVDAELSKRAIRALGEIAAHIETVSEEMTTSIVQLMEIDSPYIRAEAAKIVCDVVRVHPRLSDFVLPTLGKNIKRVDDHGAKAALIWMLGEFGNNILEAPYIIETIIDNYSEEQSVVIKLEVLSASMKLFFQRPAEMQHMLGRLLKNALNDNSNQDLHDRSLLYYRLLAGNVNAAASLFACGVSCSSIEGDFAEKKDMELNKKLFSEFNSLAVVFGMPSIQFIDERFQLRKSTVEDTEVQVFPSSSAPTPPLGIMEESKHAGGPAVVGSVNLLDWDDSTTTSNLSSHHSTPALILEDFRPDAMSPQIFQSRWMSLSDTINGKLCTLQLIPSSPADIESSLRANKIFSIASGVIPGPAGAPAGFKLFLYGIERRDALLGGSDVVYLAQVLLSITSKEVNLTLKVDQPNGSKHNEFVELIMKSLGKYNTFT